MPQISTPVQRAQWRQQGMEIDPDSGMPYGTVLRNAKGEYAMVTKEGLLSLTEAEVKKVIEGFKRGGSS